MIKSIPESTRERAREFLGCGSEGGGGAFNVYIKPGETCVRKTPDFESEDNLLYRPELEAAVYAGRTILAHVIDEGDPDADTIHPVSEFHFSSDPEFPAELCVRYYYNDEYVESVHQTCESLQGEK